MDQPVVFVPSLLMLVGMPGSGKTTFIKTHHTNSDFKVVSSDAYIEAIAAGAGKTYNEVFKSAIDAATNHVNTMINWHISQREDVIIDMTNLTAKSRARKLAPFRAAGYFCSAMVFPQPADIYSINSVRPGKTIPDHILKNMAETYQEPTTEEFDEVITVHVMAPPVDA